MIVRKICFSASISLLILSCHVPSFATQAKPDCDWDCPIPLNAQHHEEPFLNELSGGSSKIASYLYKKVASIAVPTGLRSAACPRSLDSAHVLDPANKSRDVVVGTTVEAKKVKNNFVMRRHPEFEFFAGGAWLTEDDPQFVPIDGLIGDFFSVSNPTKNNALLGIALNIDGPKLENQHVTLQYQLSTFFIPNYSVGGLVTQENLFTNMSYSYQVNSIAAFAGVKATSQAFVKNFYLTGDLGLGFNYIHSQQFRENALVPYAVPDNIFSYGSNKEFDFAVSTGCGIKIKSSTPRMDFTIGYRFIYLGQGSLPATNTLVHTSLRTGYGHLNAITGGFIYALG